MMPERTSPERDGNRRLPSEKTAQEFDRTVDNIVRHCKRSLLDMVDFLKIQSDPKMKETLELMSRRIHNDVSVVKDQVLAAHEIFRNGGVIPPFGRTAAEMDAAQSRKQGA